MVPKAETILQNPMICEMQTARNTDHVRWGQDRFRNETALVLNQVDWLLARTGMSRLCQHQYQGARNTSLENPD